MARSKTPAWMDHLPLVLLGIRTSIRPDTGWCPAELVYGATLRLPGEFLFPPEDSSFTPTTEFVSRLRTSLAAMRPAAASHHCPPPGQALSVPPSLLGVSHVYVRVDEVKRPLSRSYEGPFRVLQRSTKTFVVSELGRPGLSLWTGSSRRWNLEMLFRPRSPLPRYLWTHSLSRP